FSLFSLLLLSFNPLSLSNGAFSRSISKEEMGIKSQNTLTHLHYFFHDYVVGPRRTAVRIAQAKTTDKDPNTFGALVMIDDPLSIGPDNSSHVVGYAQGMYGFADQTTAGLLMVMNFVFTDGEYKGSTLLSVLGRNEVFLKIREMAIVGGTGKFRFASDYCQAKTISGLDKSGASVIQYDVYVSH
ncbi:pterocarpan synthase 1-like, partial [Silene latifolia]|uniref:pterocarpan synthase 1-like n=1 Tax=Silene latifolia TaxID=37657 RepID=UPI003D77A5F1